MQIAGSDFLYEQNNRLRNSLLDYSQKAAENQAVEKPAEVSSVSTQNTEQNHDAVAMRISNEGLRVATMKSPAQTAMSVAPTNFSTMEDFATKEAPQAASSQNQTAESINGNAVLNQYRFFVQSAQYAGAEGTVRRIQ